MLSVWATNELASGELAVDEYAVGGAGGALLGPVQGQPVQRVQLRAAPRQQQVREVAVEQHLRESQTVCVGRLAGDATLCKLICSCAQAFACWTYLGAGQQVQQRDDDRHLVHDDHVVLPPVPQHTSG